MTLNGRVSMSQASKVVPFRGRKGAAPNTLNGKVPPPRRKNSEVRSREHLIPDEVEKLIAAAKSVGRHGHRDATLILTAYRHGLRVSELVALRWDMVNRQVKTGRQYPAQHVGWHADRHADPE